MVHLILSILPSPRRPIVFVDPNLSVVDCAKLMSDKDIGALVVHDGKTLLGMVTEREIVRDCLYKQKDPNKTTAHDIAYKQVSILQSNESIEKAMETITNTKRRHLLVSENDELIALLSIGDVLFHLLENKADIIKHLEKYITT